MTQYVARLTYWGCVGDGYDGYDDDTYEFDTLENAIEFGNEKLLEASKEHWHTCTCVIVHKGKEIYDSYENNIMEECSE